jgi:hypothetical protein
MTARILLDRSKAPRRSTPKGRGRPVDQVVIDLSSHLPEESAAELVVRFEIRQAQAVSVTLACQDGLSPSDLQRFPWTPFLTVADATLRDFRQDPVSAPTEGLREVLRATETTRPLPRLPKTAKRPGRTGHPDEFYRAVAEQYQALRRHAVTNPTATIARSHGTSRNTAAGWVRVARQRGYLPPARPGRAG